MRANGDDISAFQQPRGGETCPLPDNLAIHCGSVRRSSITHKDERRVAVILIHDDGEYFQLISRDHGVGKDDMTQRLISAN